MTRRMYLILAISLLADVAIACISFCPHRSILWLYLGMAGFAADMYRYKRIKNAGR